MSGVPYTFSGATTAIPLTELDSNFNTPVTIGTTTVGLGNTVTTLQSVTVNGGTFTNVASNITFASGTNGIVFNNNSSGVQTSSTLNDYETGSWNPNQGGGCTVVGTFSSSGTYTKIGNLVFVAGKISGSTSIACTAQGILSSNLPFSCVSQLSAAGGVLNGSQTSNGIAFVNPSSSSIYTPNTISSYTDIYYSAVYKTTF